MSGPSSSSPPPSSNEAVTVARAVADTLVELAWATRPGQPLSDADRYQVMLALTAGLAALAQVLTQLTPPAPDNPPQTRTQARGTCREAVTAAHDLAALVDTAAQHLT